jgi:hypothetical protein
MAGRQPIPPAVTLGRAAWPGRTLGCPYQFRRAARRAVAGSHGSTRPFRRGRATLRQAHGPVQTTRCRTATRTRSPGPHQPPSCCGVAALLGDELDPPLLAEVAGEPGCCQPRDAHPARAGPGEAPSVGTLVRVADALGASVAQLVEVADAPAVPVVRASEAVPLWRRDQGNVVMLLAGTSSRGRSSCGMAS